LLFCYIELLNAIRDELRSLRVRSLFCLYLHSYTCCRPNNPQKKRT
jgi:hypothetical protein